MQFIKLQGAQWGFLQTLPDYYPGGIEESVIAPDGDIVRPYDCGRVTVGVPDRFGWRVDDGEVEHYYVALSEGTRNGRPLLSSDIKASAFYPERLFVWGENQDGGDLSHAEILQALAPVIQRGSMSFWHPTRVWRGYRAGLPLFHHALRAHTDIGATWHDAYDKLARRPLPDGYRWFYDEHQPNRGELVVTTKEEAKQNT